MKKRWIFFFIGMILLAVLVPLRKQWYSLADRYGIITTDRPAAAAAISASKKPGRQPVNRSATKPFRIDSIPLESIRYQADTIGNAALLAPFFRKLARLEQRQGYRVRIVHIGDSHIQSDFLTGELRALFQQRFGNGGRGLIFPYPMANTHAPVDLEFRSNCRWVNRRSIFQKKGPPLGIAGMSIESSFSRPTVELWIEDRHEGLDYAFNQVTIFQEKGEGFRTLAPIGAALLPSPVINLPKTREPVYYQVKAGDTFYDLARKNRCSVDDLQRWNNFKDGQILQIGQRLVVGYVSEATIAESLMPFQNTKLAFLESAGKAFDRYLLPITARKLALLPAGNSGTISRIYGILLENNQQAGVIYNMIGVNGTTFYHYNKAEHFWEQLPILEPDLVIVSLGTNEALAGSYTASAFRTEVEQFLTNLRESVGNVPVLMTTNPDVLRRRQYENPGNKLVRSVILETAKAQQAAWWDLYDIMGGEGSVRDWRKKEFAHTDFIHFTKEGYILQAQLLFDAISKAYAADD